MHRLFTLLLTIVSLMTCQAQVERTTLFGVGRASLFDTYLSPYQHTGLSASVALQNERRAHWGCDHVSTFSRYAVTGAMAESDVTGNQLYDGMLTIAGGWHYNWYLQDRRIRLAAGGLLELAGGATYQSSGGNNPVQAHALADVAASLIGEYRFGVKGQDWKARLQADLPLLGAAFCPQYGQSYYELFHLGHYDHNVRPIWPVNSPSLHLQATLAIPVRKSLLTLGYDAQVRQSHLNGLRQHAWHNQFVLGFSRHISLAR